MARKPVVSPIFTELSSLSILLRPGQGIYPPAYCVHRNIMLTCLHKKSVKPRKMQAAESVEGRLPQYRASNISFEHYQV